MKKCFHIIYGLIALVMIFQLTVTVYAADTTAPVVMVSERKPSYKIGEKVRFEFTFTDDTELYKYSIHVNGKQGAAGRLDGDYGISSATVIVVEGENTVEITLSDKAKNDTYFKFSFTGVDDSAVKVRIPRFRIHVNNRKIVNNNLKYPYIVYNDITYFPMTYHGARHLGLISNWSPETGLVISKADFSSDGDGENTKVDLLNDGEYDAHITMGSVTVNGKYIDNQSEPYPLLNFRDVTYFPLTWRFCVTEFGWKYSFTNASGLVINSR